VKWAWFCLFLLLPVCAWAAPQGAVRISVDQEKPLWVGQRVLVYLEILTTGFSFSGQRFDMPRIEGGVLLQTDSSTLKLTEEIDGVHWQILRYDLSLFAQREGPLEIPAFGVYFVGSAGYGKPETAFDLTTEALKVELQLPPGADPSQPVVTSASLSIDEQWQPLQDEFTAGDALTRTITIQAENVSAIALPVMPPLQVEGIEALTEPAVVRDKTNRGTLTGYRQEQVSYLFQRQGEYQIPAWSISWWNPESKTLERHEFDSRRLTVAANPAAQPHPGATGALSQPDNERWWLWLLLVIGLMAVSMVGVYWIRPSLRRRYAEYQLSEPYRYKLALGACRANDPAQAFRLVSEWLARAPVQRTAEFNKQWVEMQLVLVSKSGKWSGAALADILADMRKQILLAAKQVESQSLNPINPR